MEGRWANRMFSSGKGNRSDDGSAIGRGRRLRVVLLISSRSTIMLNSLHLLAYLDPASGSLLLQLILGGVAAKS